MKVITVRQPWASLIAAGVKTVETRPRPAGYRGRLAIHAAADDRLLHRLGGLDWDLHQDPSDVALRDATNALGSWNDLPLGAVVASAVLTDCVPIVGQMDITAAAPYVRPMTHKMGLRRTDAVDGAPFPEDITDQLPFGDFSPGRWALLLDDIKPTTERCPWCWGSLGDPERMDEAWRYHGIIEPGSVPPCPMCPGDDGYPIGTCDPVPARGQQAVPWEWTP